MRLRSVIVAGGLWLTWVLPAMAAAADPPSGPEVEISLNRWLAAARGYTLGLPPLNGVEGLFEPPTTLPGLRGVRYDSAFTEKDPPPVAGAEPGWRLVELKARASANAWGGRLGGETELLGYAAYAPWAPDSVSDPVPRLFRLRMTEVWGVVESGLRFESVSPGLEKVTGASVKGDQEGSEVWLAVRRGDLRFKAAASEFADNIAGDTRRDRTAKSQAGISVEWRAPARSLVTLSFARGTVERVGARPDGAARDGSQSSDFDSGTLGFYHDGGSTWYLSLSSTYAVQRPAEAGRDSTLLSHDLSGSYRATEAVTLTPALSFSQETIGPGTGSVSFSASLSAAVIPLAGPLDLALYGGYSRSRTIDGSFDARNVDASASLVWNLSRSAPKTALALETGYHRYRDAGSGAVGFEELVGQITLKIAAF